MLYAPPSSSSTSSLATFVRHIDDSLDDHSTSPLLCYYDDESLERQRGRVVLGRHTELVDCRTLTATVDHELRHLFGVRSSGRTGQRRTYYMAAAGDDELAEWIDRVRGVLKMYGRCGKIDLGRPIISCRRPTRLEQSSTSRPILIVSHHFSARTENIPVPL